MTFFSGVQYVSPTFKAGSLVLCVIHSIFYDKVCLLYTYRVRSTLSQIDIPIIWFLYLSKSKKGDIFLKDIKIEIVTFK